MRADQEIAVQDVATRAQLIEAELSALSSWEERYQRIIEMGKLLPPLPEEYRIDANKVRGCQSQVWLFARKNEQGRITYFVDSDAMIVKGLIAILHRIYSNGTPEEILKLRPDFIQRMGFETHLSPTRAGGLQAVYKQMIYFALALQANR